MVRSYFFGSAGFMPMRSSTEHSPPPPQYWGVGRWSSARSEGPQAYRRAYASTGDRLASSFFFPLFLFPVLEGRLAVSQRARVQRGESATARCASTGNRQASLPFFSLHSSSSIEGGWPRLPSTARIERGPFIVRVVRARRAPGRCLPALASQSSSPLQYHP